MTEMIRISEAPSSYLKLRAFIHGNEFLVVSVFSSSTGGSTLGNSAGGPILDSSAGGLALDSSGRGLSFDSSAGGPDPF